MLEIYIFAFYIYVSQAKQINSVESSRVYVLNLHMCAFAVIAFNHHKTQMKLT